MARGREARQVSTPRQKENTMELRSRLSRLRAGLLVLSLLVAGLAAVAPAEAGKKDDLIARYSARAYLTARGSTQQVQIGISRWSSDEERQDLLEAAREGGPAGLRAAIGEQEDHGYFRVRGGRKIALRYTREFVESGRRRVIVITEQPIPMGDMSKLGEHAERAVSIIELSIRDTQANDGRVLAAVELSFNEEGQLVFTDYVMEPVHLIEVQLRR
jgi:hypothetical protein